MESLNDRMKSYEKAYKYLLTPRSYVILRLDGKNFSKYTKNLVKPFDIDLSDAMNKTAMALCDEFNAKFAYTQSDEISILLTDIGNLDAQPMFGGSLQKLCSLSAAVATAKFNEVRNKQFLMNMIEADKEMVADAISKDFVGDIVDFPKQALFDCRVFIVPSATEAINHMVWRQQDCTRNSISMAGSANFLHKELQGLNGDQVQEKLFQEKGINWNDYPTKFKRGVVIFKEEYEKDLPEAFASSSNTNPTVKRKRWAIDTETPIFTKDREYLENLIPTF